MLKGIPYLGKDNISKKYTILSKQIDRRIEIDMLSLIENIKPKNSLFVLDGKYLSWLDDIRFNYVDHICEIPYYSYKTFSTQHKWNSKLNKADEHLEYEEVQVEPEHIEEESKKASNKEEKTPLTKEEPPLTKAKKPHKSKNNKRIVLRHSYELNTQTIDIGSKLLIYEIDTDELIEYTITSWTAHSTQFSLSELYKKYKAYCYKDEITEFSNHEPGYTFILSMVQGVDNKEARLRTRYKLKSIIGKNKLKEYRDTRLYDFFTYLHKLKADDIEIYDKMFKYRCLEFESYLFCNLRDNNKPIDNECDWDKLGKSLYYIKMTDGKIPFFIKCEWLNEHTIKSTVTWRRG